MGSIDLLLGTVADHKLAVGQGQGVEGWVEKVAHPGEAALPALAKCREEASEDEMSEEKISRCLLGWCELQCSELYD